MVNRGRISNVVSAAIFILLEIAALSLLSSSSSLHNIWINRASHRMMANIWGGSVKVKEYFTLGKQNELLAQENFRLSEELRAYKERFEEMELSKQTQYYTPNGHFSYIGAKLVLLSTNTQQNYFVIDKGSEDGIRVDSGVITSQGAIGIISAVDKHFSYGMSFMNSNVSISTRSARNGVVGTMRWDGKGSSGAVMTDVPVSSEIPVGDTILTSGFSKFYPGDIPLGVTEDKSLVSGVSQKIKVKLFQDFSQLKYVTVVINNYFDEITSLEND